MNGINLAAIFIADGFGIFLAVILLGARIWKNGRNRREGGYIRLMLINSVISCIADIIAFVCDGRSGTWAFLGVYACNFWLYISNMVMGTLWVMVLVTHVSGRRLSKPQVIMTAVLNFIGVSALIVNFFEPLVFSVSSANEYSRGILYWMYPAIEVVFAADGVVMYFIHRKRRAGTAYFPVWQFVIPIFIGILIQSFVYGVSTVWPSITIAICGIVLGLFNESEAEAEALRQHEKDRKIIIRQKNKLENQQKQLEEALALAQSASNAKTNFLFNMSHDIRTPMNAILGYTDIAIRHFDDEVKAKDSLNKIKISGAHLLNLVNDILEMSRIEAGRFELSEQPLDIREAAVGVVHMSRSLALSKSIDFTSEIGEISDPYVYADELHMNEVLINLISNAVKYTECGGKVHYAVSQTGPARAGTAVFRFEITDNGIGMSEEFQKHLFEAFAREESANVSKQEGAGLGLSIVKRIVDLSGGTISVRSRTGEGTGFTVDIPFRVMSAQEYGELTAGGTQPGDSPAAAALAGKRVLLAEDNEMNREIATEILTEAGLAVEGAEDGKIAVDMVSGKGIDYYDFILMDIQMPVMNGYEATKAIRKLPGGETVPIIAVSANAFDEDIQKSLEVGMNAHIAKPIDVKALFETMRIWRK